MLVSDYNFSMKELALILLQWIAANSAYTLDDVPLPQIVAMTPEEITTEFYGGPERAASRRPKVDPRILALYDRESVPEGRIYIIAPELTEGAAQDPDPLENPIFRERLLHELVHHVQHHNGAYDTYLCRAQGEEDAYRLGGLYLERHYVQDPLPNRAFWARIYSRC